MGGGGSSAFGFGKSKARMISPQDGGVTFQDVAGVDEAKIELWATILQLAFVSIDYKLEFRKIFFYTLNRIILNLFYYFYYSIYFNLNCSRQTN